MRSIDILPDDVLVEVFGMHVWENTDTPLRLLRVCRRWRTITANASSLWGDIVLCDGLPKFHPMKHSGAISQVALNNKVICRSVPSLASAIERTRGSKFELTVVPPHGITRTENSDYSLLKASWFTHKCRALRVTLGECGPLLSQLEDLPTLETLELYKLHGDAPYDDFTMLLERVQRTSRYIRTLRIPIDAESFNKEFSSLYSRITTLQVSINSVQSIPRLERIMKTATSVTTLGLAASYIGIFTEGQLDCISSSLENLYLKQVPCHLLSPSLASRIRHLSVQASYYRVETINPIQFPNLTHLTCIGWWPALLTIRAPKLKVLKLRNGYCLRESELNLISRAQLVPEVLDLDMSCKEKCVRDIIWENWRNVKELQIVYIHPDRSLFHQLASPLKGKTGEKPLCPELRRLVIISPTRPLVRQAKSEELLKDIRDSLRGKGFLKEVKYGWYEYDQGSQTFVRDEDPRDCKITWTNLME